MRNVITRFLLVFLIAWLPASFVHATTMRCHMMVQQHDIDCMQHSQTHHDKAHGGGHAPSGCHDCALCYSCTGMATSLAVFQPPYGEVRTTYVPQRFASFCPEQPERPPRA